MLLQFLAESVVICVAGSLVGVAIAAGGAAALFVSPGQEGRGLGKALLGLAVGWLFELGHERVKLGTAPGTRADRFYHAQGWTRMPGQGAEAEFVLERQRRA